MNQTLRKMRVSLDDPVSYELVLGEERSPLNVYLGQEIRIIFSGNIYCINCQRKTKKSFSQGFCYPCFKKLARCDMCIVKPETCHYDMGTCREPEWAQSHCMQKHIVYIANSSGLKVGITRDSQLPTRWIDQGAIQALPLFEVNTRFHSGLVEVILAEHVADKTNWRAMLKGQVKQLDLENEKDALLDSCEDALEQLYDEVDSFFLEPLTSAKALQISYPVLEYPNKITSLNIEKNPQISGTLLGIKGQYLILDNGVINLRKYTGYEATLC